jgi:hypothetical protein
MSLHLIIIGQSQISDLAFTDGTTYYVYTRAQDNATNYESGGFRLKGKFVYDISKPTVSITYPITDGYVSQSW